ncbi:hypothetical protein ACERK3_04560 [Phycisphaerales bacterium AB-hyl4]|uniref:DUF2330 domain-containing protein n=1 Tax=Natronomicrosphaera hydrolytica TaxID=3242702 RepID=A0ABV4U5J1_9BACT
MLLWLVGVAGGCTTVVVAPSGVSDPVDVLLIDHGRSTSLILPLDDEQQQVVRYAYGEYRYYAQARRHPPGALRALFLPTEATLGRRIMPGPVDGQQVREHLVVPVRHVYLIQVEREAVHQLRDELEKLFREHDGEAIDNAIVDLTFIRRPGPYTLLSNSNHTVSGWLTTLGCNVRRQSVLSRWRVDQPLQR